MKIFCQLLTALYQAQTYTWIHGLFHMSNILVVLSLWPWLPWQSLNVKQVYTKVKRLHHSDSWDNIPQLPYMCIQTLLCSTLRNCSAYLYICLMRMKQTQRFLNLNIPSYLSGWESGWYTLFLRVKKGWHANCIFPLFLISFELLWRIVYFR